MHIEGYRISKIHMPRLTRLSSLAAAVGYFAQHTSTPEMGRERRERERKREMQFLEEFLKFLLCVQKADHSVGVSL
jgi:hypothetical protein